MQSDEQEADGTYRDEDTGAVLRTTAVTVRDKLRAGLPTKLLIVGAAPLEQLLEFFREKCFSLSSECHYALAVGLFIEWLSARAHEFFETDSRQLLYVAFSYDLKFGTYDQEEDKFGLGWKARSFKNSKGLLDALLAFSDWLSLRYGATMLNPIHNNASPSDQIIFWRKWNKQKASALLAHTKSQRAAKERSYVTRAASYLKNRSKVHSIPKAFPAEHLEKLLWTGFLNPRAGSHAPIWVKWNLRDILITILCVYGGCRLSEPMHLWVDDVFIDPDDDTVALVLIHDPSDGLVRIDDPITGVRKAMSRANYLQHHCDGKRPLTQETGRRHAGWKGVLLTHPKEKAFRVFWIDKDAGRLFLILWRLYLAHVRPITPKNPWAFLTYDRQPLGTDAFDDSFRSAVRRIGLVPDKWSGTSPHGMRHRYGAWLEEFGIGEKEGQIALHHTNALSQGVYRQVSIETVVNAVARASVVQIPEVLQ